MTEIIRSTDSSLSTPQIPQIPHINDRLRDIPIGVVATHWVFVRELRSHFHRERLRCRSSHILANCCGFPLRYGNVCNDRLGYRVCPGSPNPATVWFPVQDNCQSSLLMEIL